MNFLDQQLSSHVVATPNRRRCEWRLRMAGVDLQLVRAHPSQ